MSNPTELQESYRILEIQPGAPLAEVERAYEDLAKSWDPRRFGNDEPRRRKAEKKLRQLNRAYETLSAELNNGSAPAQTEPQETPSAPPPPTGPQRHWSSSWRYLWIVSMALAMSFLLYDSHVRIEGIKRTSDISMTNFPLPEKDPTSSTGYPGNQHVQVLPALGTDGQHWLMQIERMLDGREGLRVRHVDYDGVGPDGQSNGREIHWSSALHWLDAGLAWVDHLITHEPMAYSLERTTPWANTFALGMVMLLLPIAMVRRFGSIATALLAFSFIAVYPYYEFSFVGYFDHHGLAATSELLMVLFLAGAGAGWLRNETVNPDNLSPVDKALWQWLPQRSQAKRWMIASGIAAGGGLWVSTASIIPAMAGVGLAALLCTGWMARKNNEKDLGRADATLWRVWGTSGALTSIFFYLLEYAPSHFSMRLEVNHPFYALALFGAGDILCRGSWLLQSLGKPGEFEKMWSQNWLRLGLALAMVFLLPLTIILFGEKVFVIRPGDFLMNLHQDYILEFRTFLRQMGTLSPMQIVGGISLIPLAAMPLGLLLFAAELQRTWKAVLLVVLCPALVMLTLSVFQIRWLGISCAMWCAGLAVGALVTTTTGSAYRWRDGFRRPLVVLLLALVLIPYPLFTAFGWINSRDSVGDLDLSQIVTRDASEHLRNRLGNETGVILSGPTTTTWMMYFGGFHGVGSLYWENVAGLKTAAEIYSAKTWDDAKRLIDKYHVTHIAIFSWDPFAEEYARLGKGLRLPQTPQQWRDQFDTMKDAFIIKIWENGQTRMFLDPPPWLRFVPYQVPNSPLLKGHNVIMLEVVDPPMTRIESFLRVTQYLMTKNIPDALTLAARILDAILGPNGQPDYLPGLITRAMLDQMRGDLAAYKSDTQAVVDNLKKADDPQFPFEDRVNLAVLLYNADAVLPSNPTMKPQAYLQIETCFNTATEKDLRHLLTERLLSMLQLQAHLSPEIKVPQKTVDLAMSLLPKPMQGQIWAERGSVAVLDDPKQAVADYREALKLSPNLEPALTSLARILALASDASLRNPTEALELLDKAAQSSHIQTIENIQLRACALAETGQFDDAVYYGRLALMLIDDVNNTAAAADWAAKVKLFENHQVYHL